MNNQLFFFSVVLFATYNSFSAQNLAENTTETKYETTTEASETTSLTYCNDTFICPTLNESTACNGPFDCLYPYAPDCTKYIQCTFDGRKYIKLCGLETNTTRLRFDDNLKRCEWSSTVDCNQCGSTTDTEYKLTTEATEEESTYCNDTFICPTLNDSTACNGPFDCLYPYAPDCTKYIQCTFDGRKFIKLCGLETNTTRLRFDDNLKRCEWRSTVDCKQCGSEGTSEQQYTETTITDSTTIQQLTNTTLNPTTESNIEESITKPIITSISTTIANQTDVPTLTTTPSPSLSPPTVNDCFTPDAQSNLASSCPAPRYCMFPNWTNCQGFIRCVRGSATPPYDPIQYDVQCARGANGIPLYWNDDSFTCVKAEYSTCALNVCRSLQALQELVANCETVRRCMFADPITCHGFIDCQRGSDIPPYAPITTLMPCASDSNDQPMYWNDNTYTCESRANSTCVLFK